ncbi:MAG: hypothetical protein LBJ31_05970 [Treponema sp.]|jgi:dUTPase|nr:hypothetical protein [Treponema sp.]
MEILTESDLLSAVRDQTIIKNGSEESCEGIKYDFKLSKMALTADFGRPRDIDQSKENAVIKPGEIAFVMTEESLDLPGNIYCQLSTKRKLSLDGIVILGGLIIDPNYKGRLIFGLYNLSSRSYPLLPGRKLVAGVFYKVNKKSDKLPRPINDFPDDLIKTVVDTRPNSINAVNATIGDINNALRELRSEVREIKKNIESDGRWKADFQSGLTDIQQLVKKIGENLDKEIKTRTDENLETKNEQIALKKDILPLTQVQKRLQFFLSALVSVLIGVIIYLITKLLN